MDDSCTIWIFDTTPDELSSRTSEDTMPVCKGKLKTAGGYDIGKPCVGKRHARFDEGGLGRTSGDS